MSQHPKINTDSDHLNQHPRQLFATVLHTTWRYWLDWFKMYVNTRQSHYRHSGQKLNLLFFLKLIAFLSYKKKMLRLCDYCNSIWKWHTFCLETEFNVSAWPTIRNFTWSVQYARHYKPRFVYFLHIFRNSFMYCDLWPYVWLVFKSCF